MVLVLAMFICFTELLGTCNVQQYVLLSYCTWYWYLQCSTICFTELLYMYWYLQCSIICFSYCTWYWYLQCSIICFTVELLYMVLVLAMVLLSYWVLVLAMFNNMFY